MPLWESLARFWLIFRKLYSRSKAKEDDSRPWVVKSMKSENWTGTTFGKVLGQILGFRKSSRTAERNQGSEKVDWFNLTNWPSNFSRWLFHLISSVSVFRFDKKRLSLLKSERNFDEKSRLYPKGVRKASRKAEFPRLLCWLFKKRQKVIKRYNWKREKKMRTFHKRPQSLWQLWKQFNLTPIPTESFFQLFPRDTW